MTFFPLLRALGIAGGAVYMFSAYKDGLKGDNFWLLFDCLCAAAYLYAAGKAHSSMKASRRRRYND